MTAKNQAQTWTGCGSKQSLDDKKWGRYPEHAAGIWNHLEPFFWETYGTVFGEAIRERPVSVHKTPKRAKPSSYSLLSRSLKMCCLRPTSCKLIKWTSCSGLRRTLRRTRFRFRFVKRPQTTKRILLHRLRLRRDQPPQVGPRATKGSAISALSVQGAFGRWTRVAPRG